MGSKLICCPWCCRFLRSYSYLGLVFYFICFGFSAFADIEIQDEQSIKSISRESTWGALLQLRNGSPQIKDSQFYIGGHFSTPDRELVDFVRALRSADGITSACRFPARYTWVKSRLSLPDYDLGSCPGLDEFLDKAPLERAYLVYAAENLAHPSSMLGHVLIKIEGKNSKGLHVSHGISFFTDVEGYNLPKLVLESIFLGKVGHYTLSPFEPTQNHYLFGEQRNLWTFELALDPDSRRIFHLNLFELKDVNLPYYYLSFNCATLVFNLLAVAFPDSLYIRKKEWWITPLDVVRALHSFDGLVESQATPSSRWRVKALLETGEIDSKTMTQIGSRQFADLRLSADDPRRGVLSLSLAQAYNDYQYENDLIDLSHWRAGSRFVREARLKNYIDAEVDLSSYKSPAKTSLDTHAFVGAKQIAGEGFMTLGFLPASHALTDDNSQYQAESELKLSELSIDWSPSSGRVDLNSWVLYSAIMLQPWDPLTGGVSGVFRFGYEPKIISAHGLERVGFLEGGLGRTWRPVRDIDVFMMGILGGKSGSGSSLYLNARVGGLVREIWGMKSILSYEGILQDAQQPLSAVHFSQVWNSQRYSVIGEYSWYKDDGLNRTFENFSAILRFHF